MAETRNRVYVELDALLDTRLATVAKISQEAAVTLLNDDRYYFRKIDDYSAICGVTLEAFRHAYERRNAELLFTSILTEIPSMMTELIAKLEQVSTDTPFMEGVSIEINIYPYQLEEVDRDGIVTAMMAYVGHLVPIKTVNIPLQQLTPGFVKNRYSGLIMYNLRDWLQHHVEAFKTVQMPRVTVLAPALAWDRLPEPDQFRDEGLRKGIDPFELMELAFVEMFALNLLEARYFSIFRPEMYKT